MSFWRSEREEEEEEEEEGEGEGEGEDTNFIARKFELTQALLVRTRSSLCSFPRACNSLRDRPHKGELFKLKLGSVRPGLSLDNGFTSPFWLRRRFELVGQDLTYYTEPRKITEIEAKLRALEAEAEMRTYRDEKHEKLQAQLEEKLQKVKQGCRGKTITVVTSRTQIRIPESNESYYETPFAFEVSTKGDSYARIALCADNADERRMWIRLLRSRLYTAEHVKSISKLYLPKGFRIDLMRFREANAAKLRTILSRLHPSVNGSNFPSGLGMRSASNPALRSVSSSSKNAIFTQRLEKLRKLSLESSAFAPLRAEM